MPRTKLIAITLFILLVRTASGQQADTPDLGHVEKAFSTGNIDELVAMSSDRVEIAVFGRSRLYSRSQSRFILKELFDEYPPLRFDLSTPSRTDKGLFAAGTYRYAVDKPPLRVYVRLRKSGSTWSLREILVDRTSD